MNVELSRLGNYISPPSIESSDPYFSTPANIEKGWSWEGKTEVEEEETAWRVPLRAIIMTMGV